MTAPVKTRQFHDEDEHVQLLIAVLRLVSTMPNTVGEDISGPRGFEACRARIAGHLERLVAARVKQLAGEQL